MTHAHHTAVVLAIGDELTSGDALDTNSAWLSRTLARAGVLVAEHQTLGDDADRIAHAITDAAQRAQLVITTGGLGPTADDLTRDALGLATSDALIDDADAEARLRVWFDSRGREPAAAHFVQCRRPSRAEFLPNAAGSAEGLWATLPDRSCDVACLPGPPSELYPMFESHVAPRLRPARYALAGAVHAVGLTESQAAARLGDLLDRNRSPLLGITAGKGVVSVRARWDGADAEAGRAAVEHTVAAIRQRLGEHCYAEGDDTLECALLSELRARRQTLGVVESCTGGGLGAAITAIAGSSDVFVGGLITYTNQLKERLASVSGETLAAHGAVSRETALEMASGGREALGADWAAAITGIAGPDGGTGDKPVGTVWIAASGSESALAHRFIFPGRRDAVRARSACMAAAMVLLAATDRAALIDGLPWRA